MLNTTPDYVLYEMSYENMLMYGYAAPSFDDEESAEEWDDSIDANNPDNFNDNEDEEEEFI